MRVPVLPIPAEQCTITGAMLDYNPDFSRFSLFFDWFTIFSLSLLFYWIYNIIQSIS
jgi:hypothetical protein